MLRSSRRVSGNPALVGSDANMKPRSGVQGVEQFYPDDNEGFSAKNENYDWRFLGEKTMLAEIDVQHVPAAPCHTNGQASVCPELWRQRRVYIVEGIPPPQPGSRGDVFKALVYIDAEGRAVVEHGGLPRPAGTNARDAIYSCKRLFEVAETTTDVQSGLAETCFLPSPDARE